MTRYDISPGQLDVFVNGALDAEILGDLFETIAGDPRFSCALKQFWHFQDVDCSNLRPSCLRALGLALKEEAGQSYPPVAFIAETDLLFGLCRAYAGWVGSDLIDVGVFRNYDDALAWGYLATASPCA